MMMRATVPAPPPTAPARNDGGQAQQAQHRDLDQHVEQLGRRPGPDPGGVELEQDGLGGDDAARLLGLTLHYRNCGVDIDRYIARNQPTWARLADLTESGPPPGVEPVAGRARRADPALPAHVGPPLLRPHLLPRPVADHPPDPTGRRRRRGDLRQAGPTVALGAHVLRHHVPGRAVGLAAVHPHRRGPVLRPGHRRGHLAGARPAGARRVGHPGRAHRSTSTSASSSTTPTSPTPCSSPR